jgi:anti-sigma regulatory factor (Ser/Thr protein kinase)
MHYALSDFVLDIVQNSLEAGSMHVSVAVDEDDERFSVTVEDDGRGMTERELKMARDPFYTDGIKHARRKVGLGIPFLEQAVTASGGSLDISSKKGEGTVVRFSFPRSNVDTPPTGDLVALFVQMMGFDGEYELVIERLRKEGAMSGSYRLSRTELKDVLGGLTDGASLILLKNYVGSQETSIFES